MVGALGATAMKLDRVANQMPEDTDFWDVIKAVEYWERQNASLRNSSVLSSRGDSPSWKRSITRERSIDRLHMVLPKGPHGSRMHERTPMCDLFWRPPRENP